MNKPERALCVTLSLLIANFAHAGEVPSLSLAGSSHSYDLDAPDLNADQGVYFGIGYGVAQSRFRSSYEDSSGQAFRMFAGYAPSRYVITEIGYLAIDSGDRVVSHGNIYVGSIGGRLPIGDYFSITGKAGFAFHKEDSSQSNDRSSHGNLSYGVIAAFDFNRHFGVRAEYEGLGTSVGTYDVFTFSLVVKE